LSEASVVVAMLPILSMMSTVCGEGLDSVVVTPHRQNQQIGGGEARGRRSSTNRAASPDFTVLAQQIGSNTPCPRESGLESDTNCTAPIWYDRQIKGGMTYEIRNEREERQRGRFSCFNTRIQSYPFRLQVGGL
jgi:hypothetical protein